MTDPYRAGAHPDQLAALEALPAPMVQRLLAAVLVYRRWPFPVFAPEETRKSIEAAGMQYAGNCVEWLFTVPLASRVWIDRTQTTQARLSVRGYWLCTYFESGDCILTWDHPPRTQANRHLEVHGTLGSFTMDYEEHMETVNRKRDAGDAPIMVHDLATAVALGRHYYRFVISPAVAVQLLALPVLVIVLVAVGTMRWL